MTRPFLLILFFALQVLFIGTAAAEEPAAGNAFGKPVPARIIWIDTFANCERLSNRSNIEAFMQKIKACGADTIILGVKDNSGLVIFPSRVAPHMCMWEELARGSSMAVPFPAGYDAVKDVLEVGHQFGLQVYAGFPVFTEGTLRAGGDYPIGPIFEHPEWETIVLRGGTAQPISNFYPFIFVNPVLAEVQEYELSLIREVMENYAFDGISLDYCRFASYNADFSNASRNAFEAWARTPVAVWPEDVLDGGALRRKWLEWRSGVIKSFTEKARATVLKARPGIRFSAYYGGWYRHHWGMGVNWASRDFQPNSPLASPGYSRTGMAELLDLIMCGYYFDRITRAEAGNNPNLPNVEEAADTARWVTRGKAPLAGGFYLMQYKEKPDRFREAVRTVMSKGQGIMLFDLYWIDRYNYWDIIRDAWTEDPEEPRTPPDQGKPDKTAEPETPQTGTETDAPASDPAPLPAEGEAK